MVTIERTLNGAAPKRPKLLFVDDDTLIRELMAEAMEDQGFDVTAAEDAAIALAWLAGGQIPDIMVTDYAMPDMNGLELIACVRASHPDMPVILLTGHAEDGAAQALAAAGGGKALLLRKPVRPKELTAKIAGMIE